ncbi:BCD family MFS transporter [Polynucleobacter kasalickyi]|uniref:MFS transporter, BCD family, chlorophyll transporter n=1 Tax=Polynucleobacter kasalickyi TaxID=1938817 RepID=A0A1W1Z2A3_9BURK|nr:BCD family MFS transporter [Polynucleobacter kasalickyi]SMC42607.1 MFS transporter, BCD family, chlorophyll transporter [Polynucleobacter kasalickyi]
MKFWMNKRSWQQVSIKLLPFADIATSELPLSKLVRLSLFQVTVGMAATLLIGTLNRVLILEMGVSAWIVSLMVALPIVFAPFRALIGFKSDTHKSVLGWKRVPYIWIGTILQFGGFSIMPFALILLSGDTHWPMWFSYIASALAFLMVGAGMQTTQTAGLALATDLASEEARPRVVAMMYVMLLVGMVLSGLVFSLFLSPFSPMQLIQVVQGVASVTVVLNLIAVWKQEARDPLRHQKVEAQVFQATWKNFTADPKVKRFLIMLGLGTAAFSMQDIILEPYGGEVLHLSVAQTSFLTAIMSGGAICAFALAARLLSRDVNPYRIASVALLVGLLAFVLIIFAEPLNSPSLFRIGTAMVGFGGGLFSVSTLIIAMQLDKLSMAGLTIGAWGAVNTTASGVAIFLGGFIRDGITNLAMKGELGTALISPAIGYSFVYHIEIYLLFATLIALGPLVMYQAKEIQRKNSKFGLAELPI